MSEATRQRLFGWNHAFDEPLVVVVLILMGAGLVVAPAVMFALGRAGRLDAHLRAELRKRYLSWLLTVPALVVPVLLGAAATVVGVAALSLLCYREFARATGLFRQKVMSAMVVLGILAITFGVADQWYRLFVALAPIMVVVLTAVATSLDHPTGYIQRVGLAVFGFLLFGVCLGHVGYMANDARFRSLILLLVFSVQCNDLFTDAVGKVLGGPKLVPRTNPQKTVTGALGAILLTTMLVFWLAGLLFRSGPMNGVVQRLALGVLISVAGQLGDLSISAIYRDLGLKDAAASGPGFDSVLDRANSLLLAAPAVFHYINYLDGLGATATVRSVMAGG